MSLSNASVKSLISTIGEVSGLSGEDLSEMFNYLVYAVDSETNLPAWYCPKRHFFPYYSFLGAFARSITDDTTDQPSTQDFSPAGIVALANSEETGNNALVKAQVNGFWLHLLCAVMCIISDKINMPIIVTYTSPIKSFITSIAPLNPNDQLVHCTITTTELYANVEVELKMRRDITPSINLVLKPIPSVFVTQTSAIPVGSADTLPKQARKGGYAVSDYLNSLKPENPAVVEYNRLLDLRAPAGYAVCIAQSLSPVNILVLGCATVML